MNASSGVGVGVGVGVGWEWGLEWGWEWGLNLCVCVYACVCWGWGWMGVYCLTFRVGHNKLSLLRYICLTSNNLPVTNTLAYLGLASL
jgi:hypothetical protein